MEDKVTVSAIRVTFLNLKKLSILFTKDVLNKTVDFIASVDESLVQEMI
jgi:hypothetical protein